METNSEKKDTFKVFSPCGGEFVGIESVEKAIQMADKQIGSKVYQDGVGVVHISGKIRQDGRQLAKFRQL